MPRTSRNGFCGWRAAGRCLYNFTEQDAWQLCENVGLLSPVHAFTDWDGYWFCPNAKMPELRHLYAPPDLRAMMLALQAISGKVQNFNRTQKFSDIEVIFRQEDEDTAQVAQLGVLLWPEDPKISRRMAKIEKHPSLEKLLRQIIAQTINGLELSGQTDHPTITTMETGADLIAKAWKLPQELLQSSIDLIQRQKQNILSGWGHPYPTDESLESYNGPMIVELFWGLFETAVKLEGAQDWAIIHELEILMADSLSLDEWVEACGSGDEKIELQGKGVVRVDGSLLTRNEMTQL